VNSEEQKALRTRLLEYPGTTEENVNLLLDAYEERADLKLHLTTERGMSNMMAERFLDMQGLPRPPGWHSAFFYPGGLMPRVGYIILAVFAVGGFLIFAK
jgi:hypothetical protein